MPDSSGCRVLIADDHAIVRNAVKPLLQSIRGVTVVGEAADGIAAIALTKKLKPDVLILDITMPHAGGIAVIGEVRRFSPQTRIAVLTAVTRAGTMSELLSAGVDGILLKSCSPQELQRGLGAIIAGTKFIAAEARAALDAATMVSRLTMRERQVLSLVAQGKSNGEIAALLNISPKTVDHHRTSLMEKLGVHSAAELTATAIREGLIDAV